MYHFFDGDGLVISSYQAVAPAGTLAVTAPLGTYQRHTVVIQGDGAANGSHDVTLELDTAGANELFPEGTVVHMSTNGGAPVGVALPANGVIVIPASVTAEVMDVRILLDNLVYQDDQTGLIVTVTNNGAGAANVALAVVSEQNRY